MLKDTTSYPNNKLLDIVKDQLPELVNFFDSIKDTVKCNIQD